MNSKKNLQKVCNICGKSVLNGIMLRKGFICTNCERKIVHLSVKNKDYDEIKIRIKEMIF